MKENAVLDTKRKLTKCSSYGDCHFDEMSHLNEILIEHNAELIDRIHACAHDIREPIRCLDGVMQLYNIELETYQNEISEQYIHLIFGSIKRIKELVSEYLEKTSTDNTKRKWDVIDSLRIISLFKEYLYVQIKSTNTTINVIPPLLPIFGNLVQIKQVFSNLIDNAIKYRSVEPPLITVSSVKKNGFVYFSVEDNGIGIPVKDQNTIFEKFKRSNKEYVTSDTGIGLDICRKVVKQHGGSIEVTNNTNGGVTFVFSLPSAEAKS